MVSQMSVRAMLIGTDSNLPARSFIECYDLSFLMDINAVKSPRDLVASGFNGFL